MRALLDREFELAQPIGGPSLAGVNQKSVAILLATFNGAAFLAEQLDSIERQTHSNWRVYASDDGSSDATHDILAAYRERWGEERLSIAESPQRGHAANFLSLAQDLAIQADYYAFCDQDDVWLEDKLERSIRSIADVGETKPALYGSRTELINEAGRVIGLSMLFWRAPSLKNALVQSIAGGNTMVFNNATRDCLKLIPPTQDVITHDWATYLLVCACDGMVFYDASPSVLYRQHGDNIIGSNNSFMDRLVRLLWLWKGRFASYCDNNLSIIAHASPRISDQNSLVIENFKAMRAQSLIRRLTSFKRSGLYRQTALGTLGLWVAVFFNKI
jgi:glycosyltransferase involved in cell wall biosynthesis